MQGTSAPGQLFVVRNVGNVVPCYGTSNGQLAAVEYAVVELGIEDVIVCGHTSCGAMNALLDPSAREDSFPGRSLLEARLKIGGTRFDGIDTAIESPF